MSTTTTQTTQTLDFQQFGETLFKKSLDIITKSQLPSGGTTASLPGTRYAGFVYPRDHSYATQAFVVANAQDEAKKALHFILQCEVTSDGVMYQRYNESGKNASYKPPQIDGNAQTLFAFAQNYKVTKDKRFLIEHQKFLKELVRGITSQTKKYDHGSLVFSANGIIEYAVFEQGFDLYTNAICYRALKEMASVLEDEQYDVLAEEIKDGISYYLYYEPFRSFIPCMRAEPDVSYVILANLKNILALVDFDVFSVTDERITATLAYHMHETYNAELLAYNRYHHLMDRHNFGDGPWPMVMARLAQYYIKVGNPEKAKKCFSWIMHVAQNNLDFPMTLPEHVSTKTSFNEEYLAFKKLNETAPRPAKEKEYEVIKSSKTYNELDLAYAINPLTWSHSQFILAWNDWRKQD